MKEPLIEISSITVPLIQINVDTDAIIPSREMKRVSKQGLSEGLFANWRYKNANDRVLDPEFILNNPKYNKARILLSGDNFGCGSSREHAVWALHEYGFRVIIAPSFGAIFYKSCIKNGILPIKLDEKYILQLIDVELHVNLREQTINPLQFSFDIAPQDKKMLLEGLDDIDLNLLHQNEIEFYEKKDKIARPWAYL